MVAPITGPFVWTAAGPGWEMRKERYRQRRPYNLNLPYEASAYTAPHSNTLWRWKAFTSSVSTDRAYAQAYERLVGKLGDSASLGVTLAQWKQANSMMGARAQQLLAFTLALKRGDAKGIVRALGVRKQDVDRILSKRYGVAGKLSDLWLEFWFGWKPMITDIYAAAEVFDQPLPWARYRGRGSSTMTALQPAREPDFPGWDGYEGIEFAGEARVEIAIDVRLRNANEHLMNQFGINNPATIAFELIPWSFLLGWVSNVNSWMRSFTDFAGLETSNGYISRKVTCTGRIWKTGPYFNQDSGSGSGRRFSRVGVSTLARPSFFWKELKFEPTRALTAISLLTQQLVRLK